MHFNPRRTLRTVRMLLVLGVLPLCLTGAQRIQQPALAGITIVIDPGHGGSDLGFPTVGSQMMEKELVLDIAQRLRRQLEVEGATVFMLRDTDRFVSLPARVRYANALLFRPDNQADRGRLVSLHLNSNRQPNARRVEVFVEPAAEPPFTFAADLAAKLRAVTGGTVGYIDAGYPEGVHPADIATIRWTFPRGHNVLSESAFLSNAAQAEQLQQPEFRELIAQAHLAALREELAPGNR